MPDSYTVFLHRTDIWNHFAFIPVHNSPITVCNIQVTQQKKRSPPLLLSTHLSQVLSGHLGCTQTHSWNQTLALHAGNSSPSQFLYTKFHHKTSMPSAQSLMLFSSGKPFSSTEQIITSCPLHVWHTSLLQAWLTLLKVAAVIIFSPFWMCAISTLCCNILDLFLHLHKHTGAFTLVCCMILKLAVSGSHASHLLN